MKSWRWQTALLLFVYVGVWGQGKEKTLFTNALRRLAVEPASIDVLAYDGHVTLQPELSALFARVDITLRTLQTLSSIRLDAVKLTVDSVTCDQVPIRFHLDHPYLYLDCVKPIPAMDTLKISVFYRGGARGDGFGGIFFTDRFIFTVGQGVYSDPPSMTRYWMPCHDEPFDKAQWSVEVTAPQSMTVVSNGRQMGREIQDGWAVTRFQETHPIATYLMAISAGSFALFQDQVISVSGDTIPLFFYAYPEHQSQAQVDWQRTAEMISFFATRFGAYPFDSYGMVELPLRGAMEHQTMTSFSTFLVTGDRQYENIVAHELGHQWWGDWVTVGDWRDLWLNEGFATYCEALWQEHLHGDAALRNTMNGFASSYLEEVNRYGSFSIYDPVYSWGATVYEKGAWILHMLRFIMGDERFFYALQEYGRRYAYANAVTEDFAKVVSEIMDQDLDWFFQQWIYQAGIPEWGVAWQSQRLGDGRYELTLSLEQKQTTNTPFITPVELEIQTLNQVLLDTIQVKQKNEQYTFYMAAPVVAVQLDPHEWVLKRMTVIGQPVPPGLSADQIGLTDSYPNPFHRQDHPQVAWQLMVAGITSPIHCSVRIFDLSGQEVVTVADRKFAPGVHLLSWDGKDGSGCYVSSGVYFCRLQGAEVTTMKKLLMVN